MSVQSRVFFNGKPRKLDQSFNKMTNGMHTAENHEKSSSGEVYEAQCHLFEVSYRKPFVCTEVHFTFKAGSA
jgi:hypothetical protein